MSIYRRGNVWWYAITIKGKLYRGSCLTELEVEAKEFHDRLRSDIWRGKVVGDKTRKTVEEGIERFLQEHEHKRSYKDDVRFGVWWTEKFREHGIKFLDEITPDLVKAIRDIELRSFTTRGQMKPATVNRKLAFLRTVVNAAARDWQWIDTAPRFKLLPGETERRRFLEPHEVLRLVAALPSPFADMALFAVSTGLRQANVFGLRWNQVNLTRRMLSFPDMVMKNGLPFSCALNETAAEVIRKWVGRDEEFVFVLDSGKPAKELSSKVWKSALEKAGLTNVRWHDLRHTWASLLRQAGIELSDLQEMGGWQSGVMVQRYAHLNIEHLVSKANVMDGVLSRNPNAQILHIAR